jgi:hypothetical protein
MLVGHLSRATGQPGSKSSSAQVASETLQCPFHALQQTMHTHPFQNLASQRRKINFSIDTSATRRNIHHWNRGKGP